MTHHLRRMRNDAGAAMAVRPGADVGELISGRLALETHYEIECRGADGRVKWRDDAVNLVVNAGLDDLLNQYFKGSAYTASFFVGLTDGTPTIAAGDLMSSHVGWVEVTAYAEAVRQALALGTVSGQSVDNAASKAVFSINGGGATVGGAFITDTNTKGGATGLLYGAAAFSGGDRLLAANDTLNVTATLTAAAA